MKADGTGGTTFDVSSQSSSNREANERELFNFYAPKIGGVQTFKMYTRNSNTRDMVASVEFTTKRTPWANAQEEGKKRSFVAASYKSFDKAISDTWTGTYWQAFATKYLEFSDVDSDGDGLVDRFENGIGTCAYPVDSPEYANSPYCKDVKDPQDTDGDGVKDGVEVKSTTPILTDTGFKLEGTDPTVAPQKPSEPEKPTGEAGQTVKGATRPYEVVELYDLTSGKLIASTVANEKGEYELVPGKILARTDEKHGNIRNKYGNNIMFANAENEANRIPEYWTSAADGAGYTVPAGANHNVAVRVWSDGMDPLGTTGTTRPQFDKPTGVLASMPEIPPTTVENPDKLTEPEKGSVKDNVTKAFPDATDVTVGDGGSATVTVGGNTYTIPVEDLVQPAVKPDAEQSEFDLARTDGDNAKPATGESMTLTGTVKDPEGQPMAGRDLTVQLPNGTTIPATTKDDGTLVAKTSDGGQTAGEPITFPAKAGDVKVYDGTSATGDPLFTETIAVSDPTKAEITDAPASAVAGKEVTGLSATVTDAAGEAVPDGTKVYVKVPGDENPREATVTSGKVEIPGFTPEAGTSPARVEVFSDAEGTTSIGSTDIPVVDKAIGDGSTLTVAPNTESDDEINPGDTVKVDGTIVDEDGEPIAGRDLTVVLPDGTEVPATTDENGKIVAKGGDNDGKPITFPAGDTDGTVKVFDGTPDAVNPATATPVKTADVDVKDRSITSADIAGAPEKAYVGSEVSGLTATIKDGEGDKVTSGTVYVQTPGMESPQPAQIKSDGTIDIPAFTPNAEGTAEVKVFADAAGETELASATIPVETKAINTDDSEVSVALTEDGDQNGDGVTNPGDTVKVEGTIVDEDGEPITGRDLTVVLPDGTQVPATTDENGKIVAKGGDNDGQPITFTAGDADGTIKVYDGTDTQGEPVLTADVDVKNPAPLEVEITGVPTEGTVGHEVTGATAAITDADGDPVPDGTKVYVTVPGKDQPVELSTKDGKVEIPAFTPTATGENKVVVSTAATDGTTLGEATVNVSEQAVDPSKSTAEVALTDSSDDEINPGDEMTLTGTVVDGDKVPVAGRDFTVVLPDGTQVPATTDEDGNIVAKTSENGQTAGQPITFDAADGDVKVYEGIDTTGDPFKTITVDAKDRSITSAEIVGAPTQAKTGSEVSGLTATIKDGEGDKVTSGTVYVQTPGMDAPQAAQIKSDGTIDIPSFTAGDPNTTATVKVFSDAEGTKGIASKQVPVVDRVIGDDSAVKVVPNDPADKEVTTGDTVKVEGTIVDEDGEPIAGRDLTVVLPDGTKVLATTDSEGTIVAKTSENGQTAGQPITFTAGETDGTIKVYEGTNTDADPVAESPVKVVNPAPATGSIAGNDTEGTVAHEVTAGTVTVNDKDGNPVPDGTTVYVKNPVTGTITPVTVTDGKATLPNFTPTKPGDYTIAVYTDDKGTTLLKGAEATVKVAAQTIGEGTTVTATPTAPKPGETVTIDGTVVDETGTPIAGHDVTVVLPDGIQVPAKTDENGNIVGADGQPITYTAGEGDGDIKVYDGTQATGDPASSTTVTLDVPRTVEFDGVPSDATVANPISGITAKVLRGDGTPVSDGTTVTYTDPSGKAIELTVADGKVTIPEFTPTAAGDVNLPLTYGTGATPLGTATVSVAEQTAGDGSTLTTTPSQPNKGDTVTIGGTLVDGNGTPIAGRDVTVVLPDGTQVPAKTDENGNIVGTDGQPITFTADGSGEVKVLLDGQSAAQSKVDVKGSTTGANTSTDGKQISKPGQGGKLPLTGSTVAGIGILAATMIGLGIIAVATRRRKED